MIQELNGRFKEELTFGLTINIQFLKRLLKENTTKTT